MSVGALQSDNELPGYGATVAYSFSNDETGDDYGEGKEDIYDRTAKWWKQWDQHAKDWTQEAKEDFDFYSLSQWSEEDKDELAAMGRVPIVFDRTAPLINMVSGLEINNRQEVTYYPRQQGSTGPSELLNSAAMWVRGGCDAEDEESDAFKDMLICGMGWAETRMDFEENPDGKIVEERIDAFEMFWDPGASKKNLSDAKYVGRIRKWAKEDVIAAWPKADIKGDAAPWDNMDDIKKQPHDATAAPFYRNDQSAAAPDPDQWAVCHIQWKEKEECVRVKDPGTGELKYMPMADFTEFAEKFFATSGKPIKGYKMQQTVVWQAFICGSTVLEVTKGAYENGFTFNCMTGYRDRNKRTWYGLMRAMKDPQRWSNKLYSQILYIINSQSKGGIMAEADAITDIRQLEQDWTDPSGIAIFATGAISQNKVKEKPVGQVAPALANLLEQAIAGVTATTGVNEQAMGQANDDESGYLVHQRRQSAMTVVAPFFDAKRLFTKQQGRVLLYFIQNYVPEDELIRVGGPGDAQYIPLTRDKTTGTYDIVVDESPSSPDQKERDWASLVQILPMAAKMEIPIPPEIINYLPLSPKLQQIWLNYIKQKQSAPPDPLKQAKVAEAQTAAGLNAAKTDEIKVGMVDTVNRLHADTSETYSRAGLNQAEAGAVQQDGTRKDFQVVHDATMDLHEHRHKKQDAAAKNAHLRDVLGLGILTQHHAVKKDQAELQQGQQQLDQSQQQIDNPPAPATPQQ